MKAYKKTVTLKSTGKLTLTGLPFKAGEKLDVIVLAEEKKTENVKVIKALFRETRKNPRIRRITEEEICSEIKKYRSGR
jgi:hypothetical protein